MQCQFETYIPTKKQLLTSAVEGLYLQAGACRVIGTDSSANLERNVSQWAGTHFLASAGTGDAQNALIAAFTKLSPAGATKYRVSLRLLP
jgi:hypothetical protein